MGEPELFDKSKAKQLMALLGEQLYIAPYYPKALVGLEGVRRASVGVSVYFPRNRVVIDFEEMAEDMKAEDKLRRLALDPEGLTAYVPVFLGERLTAEQVMSRIDAAKEAAEKVVKKSRVRRKPRMV